MSNYSNIKRITDQKEKRKINSMMLLFSSLVILFEIMPIFLGYFSAYTELVIVIMAFISFLPITEFFFKKLFSTGIWVILFFVFQNLTRNDGIILSVYKVFVGFFVVALMIYLSQFSEENKVILKYLFWVMIAAITITQITSIIGFERYPDIARLASTGSGTLRVTAAYGADVSGSRLNIGGYILANTASVVSIVMIALARHQCIPKIIAIVHMALTFVFLVEVRFTIALIVYCVAVASVLISKGNIKVVVALAIIAVLFISVLAPYLADFFDYLSFKSDNRVYFERFRELSRFFSGDSISNSDLEARFEYYTVSLEAFFKNFFWGGWVAKAKIGGHSAILDFLAMGGILALVVIVVAFRKVWKDLFSGYKGMSFMNYIYVAVMFYVSIGFVNTLFSASSVLILLLSTSGAAYIISEKNKIMDSQLKE